MLSLQKELPEARSSRKTPGRSKTSAGIWQGCFLTVVQARYRHGFQEGNQAAVKTGWTPEPCKRAKGLQDEFHFLGILERINILKVEK